MNRRIKIAQLGIAILTHRKHHKGWYAVDAENNPITDLQDPERLYKKGYAFCAMGCLIAAATLLKEQRFDAEWANESYTEALDKMSFDINERFLMHNHHHITEWNDMQSTTKEDVINLLREFIARERNNDATN